MSEKLLSGYRVLDITQLIAGSGATVVLADMGADVIKIESKTGDIMRSVFMNRGGFYSAHAAYNRGKRSLCLDLKREECKEIVRSLAKTADVLVENFRPRVLERLALGDRDLRSINERLVYVSVNGYGPSGPYADYPAMDMTVQALTGFCYVQHDDESCAPELIRVPLVDKTTAQVVAQWTLAALLKRGETGKGCHVGISMLDVALSFAWHEVLNRQAYVGDGVSGRRGLSVDWIAKTKDGYIMWTTGGDKKKADILLDAMNRGDLRTDPRFSTNEALRANTLAYVETITPEFQSRTTEDWLAFLRENGIMASPVLPSNKVLDDPQVRHRDMVRSFQHETAGECRYCNPPAVVDGVRYSVEPHAASLGQHTDEILRDLGYSSQKVAELRASEAIF